MDGRLAAFVAVATLLIVTPGPDTALVTRNVLRYGRQAASLTVYGVALGSAAWGLASVLGVAVLLEASALAFTILKFGGAAYLCVLGLITLFGFRHSAGAAAPREVAGRTAFAQGVLGNLLNPKAGAIFVTVFPQFIRPGDPPLRLLAMLAAYELVLVAWLTLYAYVVARGLRGRAGDHLRRLTGVVLIGLGLRLATERASL